MLSNLNFTERKDCFCHVNLSENLSISNGSFLKITSLNSKKSFYVTCKSVDTLKNINSIEINGFFGWHNNFKHDEEICLYIMSNNTKNYVDEVNFVPLTNDDWELINTNWNFIQNNFLHQLCCLQLGGVYTVWNGGSCMTLRCDSTSPDYPWSFVTSSTLLNINPMSTTNFRLTSNNSFVIKKQKTITSNTIQPRSFTYKTLNILIDFIYYLIFGKTRNQKRIESSIFSKWYSDFNINDISILKRTIIGRCYRSKICSDDNIILNLFTKPVTIIAPSSVCSNLQQLMLGTFEILPFTYQKNNDLNKHREILNLTCFINFLVNIEDQTVQFVFPNAIWNEIELHRGDRALCRISKYDKIVIRDLIIQVPLEVDIPCSHKVMGVFLDNIDQIDDDFVPLLVRQNMKILINIEGKAIQTNVMFKVADKSKSASYGLFSKYFFRNSIINVMVQGNKLLNSQNNVTNYAMNIHDKENSLNGDHTFNSLIQIFDKQFHTSCNILLHGPSGVGKSFFCKTMCNFLSNNEDHQYFAINIDCRDIIGMQVDSVKKRLMNLLQECCWRSPSLLCLDNLDSLVFDNFNETDNSHLISLESLAYTFKYFYEMILQVNAHCKVITITTCNDMYDLHRVIIGNPSAKNVLFEKIIDMSECNKNLCLSMLSKYSNEWMDNGLFDYANKEESFNYMKRQCDVSHLCNGTDAVAIMKNALVNATKKDMVNSVVVDKNDFQDAFNLYLLKTNKKKLKTKLYFTNLYGLDQIKRQLMEMFIWPSTFPKLFKKSPIKLQQGLLMYGLPGCGKSQLALALSNEIKMNFIMVKGPELLRKYIGASEEQVRNLFKDARKSQPTLIFFDEFDSLVPRRGHDSTGVTDRVVNQLLTEIDGVSGTNNAGIFILAASNRPDLIDPAILRPGRISGRSYFHQPLDVSERIAVLEFLLNRSKLIIAKESYTIWDYLMDNRCKARWLELYSYADLVGIVNVAENYSVIRYDKMVDCLECTMELVDFKTAEMKSRSSLTQVQINEYLNAYASFENLPSAEYFLKSKVTLA